MIIEQIMTKEVITLSPDDSIKTAHQLMRDKKIRYLPLLRNDNSMVGLVTERDIKNATPSFIDEAMLDKQYEKPLSSIMTTNMITGHPLDFVEDAAALFYHYKISCLPIINRGKLVGIITGTDLLHTFVELTGANKPGSQIEVQVKNRPGVLYEVSKIFKDLHINVHSVLVYPNSNDDRYKILVFRVATKNPLPVIKQLKEDTGLQVLWPNVPGLE